jgi:bifunctional DNA-binding transcriptional regulator/antitoxin component of YhaV-PrlF toxin-antitoxin module
LPKPVREALGLEAGDRVIFRVHDRGGEAGWAANIASR